MIIFYDNSSDPKMDKDTLIALAKKNKANKIVIDDYWERTEFKKIIDSICIDDVVMCKSIADLTSRFDTFLKYMNMLHDKGAHFISLEEKINTKDSNWKSFIKIVSGIKASEKISSDRYDHKYKEFVKEKGERAANQWILDHGGRP